ncbi:hypothetical protein GCM10023114_32410 [Mycolicibacterium sediminis]|uniref:Uncharacterized protein n=1 Tax=Mycolicibacterium sediminis TaxID=1286180 RepID=A0A7I7R0G0_9MYCO|nr:hypothetical protein MSEDJ_58030 [Mycolicibacterium sediminis]
MKVTVVPGCADSNCSPSVVKVDFSEAAAKTVRSPVTSDELVVDEDAESDPEPEHPATRAAAPITASAMRAVRFTSFPQGFRR